MTKHIARIVILALALGPWSTPAWAQQSPAIPVSATSLPLPSGASTSANQSSIITELQAVNTALGGTVTVDNAGTFAVQAAQSGTWTVQPGNTANTTAWLVTGTGGTFPATQSGTWNVTNVSGTVSLPTGASTAANQSTAITALQLIDNPVGSASGGTAGTSSFLVGGVYNSTLPTLTNGQQAAAQFSSRGALISTLVAADGTAWTPSTDFAHSGALTIGTSAGPAVMGRASAAAPSTTGVVDDDAVHAWMYATGATVASLVNAAGTNAFGTAGSGSTAVLTVQGNASGTAIPVSLASVPSHAVTNAGTFATQPAGSVAHDAAASGVNPVLVGGYASATVPTAVSTATDSVRAWYTLNGASVVANNDPCSRGTKVYLPISQATSTELFTGTASSRTFICSVAIMQRASSTQTWSLVSGTGTTCATSTSGVIGGTTAANGTDLSVTQGNGGFTILKTDTDADNVCLLQSSTDRINGYITYVVAADQ